MWALGQIKGSRTRLVVRIAHSRRPLALASPPRAFARTRAAISRSQVDLVLFLITKRVREPFAFSARFTTNSLGKSNQTSVQIREIGG